MKVLIVSPSMEPYGGVRVILNWAKYIAAAGHEVTLASVNGAMSVHWFDMGGNVFILHGWPQYTEIYDVVIATNPDTVMWLMSRPAKKKIYLCQMAEELFNPTNEAYIKRCIQAAGAPFPMITVADWVKYRYNERTAPTHVVMNGIDDDFEYWRNVTKDKTYTILVEGWEANNAAKDEFGVAPKAIERLKNDIDCKVIAYGQKPLERFADVVDEYYQLPSTKELCELYNRAHFFVKASRYETRSLAPLEAMACGCIPVVSVVHGHPDLKHRYNCFRAQYSIESLYDAIIEAINSDQKALIQMHGFYTRNDMRWMDVINKQIIPLLK